MYPLWEMRENLSFYDSGTREDRRGDTVLSPGKLYPVADIVVAVCPTGAVVHADFPPEKVHAFDYKDYPAAEQMMLLCRARRSNRAFAGKTGAGSFTVTDCRGGLSGTDRQ